jgi:hypothetical protein
VTGLEIVTAGGGGAARGGDWLSPQLANTNAVTERTAAKRAVANCIRIVSPAAVESI